MPRIIVCLFISLSLGFGSHAQTPGKPFILPVQGDPGLDTWLLGQAYGNTTGAFNFGDLWYEAGQGLHFGLDFSAPCGTPLVAVADGFVAFVDNFGFGSRPHNVILRHPELGLTTLYGHLQTRSALVEGQPVSQGDVIGLSGDPDETCESRPHLHFEVRSADFRTALNPVEYIEANWHNLASIGRFGNRFFQQDLTNPRRWMSLDDQPDVAFGGAILNNYAAAWPPARGEEPPDSAAPPRTLAPFPADATMTLRRIGFDSCCWDYWWHPTQADHFFTVDGAAGQVASVFQWSAESGEIQTSVGTAPRPFYSPDHSHTVTRADDASVQIRNLQTDEAWLVNTGGPLPAISPDNQRLMWQQFSAASVPGGEEPAVQLTVSDIRGGNAQQYDMVAGANAMWLDDVRLLLTVSQRPYTTIAVFNTLDDSLSVLGQWYRPRGITVAPGGGHLLFYLMTQPDPAENGLYLLETTAGASPQRLDWFGGWRWRDSSSLYYIPFEPDAPSQRLLLYDIRTGQSRALTDPATQPFTIMNGNWEVSADGSRIAFHNALDRNLWFLEAE